jgi:hypothetical protein
MIGKKSGVAAKEHKERKKPERSLIEVRLVRRS